MESHLLQYEGGGVSPPGAAAVLQCWDCFRRFRSEAALIQHLAQTNLMCTFPAKPLFLDRLKQQQQPQEAAAAIIPKMAYQFEESPPLLDTEEGSGTNDPFGDGNVTLDLVSPMDHPYHSYYDFVAANNAKYHGASNSHHNQQDLDLELKL